MKDFRLQAVGGMAGAIDVWKMGICTKLLANCNSWIGCGKPAFRQLNLLQNSYLRMVYSCPPSTPIPALRALAGLWDIEHKVALEKVCLVTTVMNNRKESNYTRELLEEELLHSWPGITQEVRAICQEMKFPDATQQFVSRQEAKEEMNFHQLSTLKREMEGKSKCDKIYNQDLRKMQVFMQDKSLENARMEVLWLTDMIDTRSTMKGKYNKKYTCPHCQEGRDLGTIETPLHLMSCQAYLNLREGISPEEDFKDRAGYLRKVISRRKELELKLGVEKIIIN